LKRSLSEELLFEVLLGESCRLVFGERLDVSLLHSILEVTPVPLILSLSKVILLELVLVVLEWLSIRKHGFTWLSEAHYCLRLWEPLSESWMLPAIILSPLSMLVVSFDVESHLFEGLKLLRHNLVGLFQHFDQIWCDGELFLSDERMSEAFCSSSSSSSNSMDIVFDARRHVVIDHQIDIFDIKASGGDICCQ
jgi:hypothetical protein